jgi:hypothetical protein
VKKNAKKEKKLLVIQQEQSSMQILNTLFKKVRMADKRKTYM